MVLDHARALLGEPFFETQDFLLYNLDCLDGMRRLPDELIDLSITSPPYNIGKTYETPKALPDYLSWCASWMSEIHRLTSDMGAFWLNLGYLEVPGQGKAVPIPYLLWNRSPFHLLQEIVWNYGAGVHTSKMFSPRNEKFLWFVKSPRNYTFNIDAVRDPDVKYPNQRKNGKLKCNPLGKNPSDVWQLPKVTSGKDRASKERTPHPAQFPLAVIDRIVKASSHKGQVILDPFIGSGTTAVAALANGRKIIGFEMSEAYCQLAQERVVTFLRGREQASAQATLFSGV